MPQFGYVAPRAVVADTRSPTASTGTGGYTAPELNYDLTGNLTESAAKQNLQGMDELTAMANYINTLNRAAQLAANQARIPGGAGLEAQSSQNIKAGLAGEIDPGTAEQIANWAASRGIMSGSVGGPINETAFLKLMSDTAYEREQQAQQNLSAAYARNPAAPLFDIGSQLIAPGQAGQLSLSQAELIAQNRLKEQELAEQKRQALVREQLAREELAARAAQGSGRPGVTSSLPSGIIGSYSPGGVYRSLSSGYTSGAGDWTGAKTAEDVAYDQYLSRPEGSAYATPAWGYQPVTSGSMYMGTVEGYQDPYDAWLEGMGYNPQTGEEL